MEAVTRIAQMSLISGIIATVYCIFNFSKEYILYGFVFGFIGIALLIKINLIKE